MAGAAPDLMKILEAAAVIGAEADLGILRRAAGQDIDAIVRSVPRS